MEKYDDLMVTGEALKNKGEFKKAATVFRKAAQLKPEGAEPQYMLGVTQFMGGHLNAALTHFRKAQKIDPDDHTLPNNIGMILFRLNRLDQAVKSIQRALKKNPEYPEALLNLSRVFAAQDRIDEASEALEKCLSLEPDSPGAKALTIDLMDGDQIRKKLKETEVRIKVLSPSEFDDDKQRQVMWGDHWVKVELEEAFNKMGFIVDSEDPDVIFYLYGFPIQNLPQKTLNLVWLYSHPDTVTPENLKGFDTIFCLSPTYSETLRAFGYRRVETMIGATSKTVRENDIHHDIVFVGNVKSEQGRPIISDLGEVPYRCKIWGNGWDTILPESMYGGRYVDYRKLDDLYASSRITLNDHHPDMAREGFLGPRIFNVLASGGFVISDKNSGIEAIFGDTVPQYGSPEELRELIDYYMTHEDERRDKMRRGREIALNHTYTKRAEQVARTVLKRFIGVLERHSTDRPDHNAAVVTQTDRSTADTQIGSTRGEKPAVFAKSALSVPEMLKNIHLRPVQVFSFPHSGDDYLKLLLGKAFQLQYGLDVKTEDLSDIQYLHQVDKRIPPIRFSYDDQPHSKRIPEMEGRKTQYRGMDVVFLCRDPKDVVVSHYLQVASHHTRQGDTPDFNGSLEEFIRHEHYGIQNIITFMNIWAANRYIPLRFHIVRYEELKTDPSNTLHGLMDFIGHEPLHQDLLDQTLKFCNADNERCTEAENDPNAAGQKPNNPDDTQSFIIEKGEVGVYKDHLGERDIEFIDRMVVEKLDPIFGYTFGQLSKRPSGQSSCVDPVFIHIGYFKAASTWLQDLLSKTSGIRLLHKPDFITDDTRYHEKADVLADLAGGNGSKPHSLPLLVSDEHYSIGRIVQKEICHLSPHALNLKTVNAFLHHDIEGIAERLKQIFPEAKILMVIRSQTKWLLSVYKHNILNLGVDMDFDKYLESAQGSVYVQAGNFHRMVERYASLFGDERIRVVLFEEIIRGVKSVFDDLSDFFNVHIDPGLVHNSSLNQGIDAVTAHILMKMNREAETDPVRKENKRYIQARHNLLQMKKYWEKDFLFSNFKLMNDDRKRWIQDHFKEGNIRLAEMIGKTSSMREYGYLECALDK